MVCLFGNFNACILRIRLFCILLKGGVYGNSNYIS